MHVTLAVAMQDLYCDWLKCTPGGSMIWNINPALGNNSAVELDKLSIG